ncbi:MAG TPA: class I SAM-dependent methyltransferase [Bacteroidia bacterium]|jgi:2-polyprenyl-3-methyl-5-hydroxy-6-metoxy-1,4-benzoquinol methylase
MKKIIQNSLALLGLEIRRKPAAAQKGFEITSPLEHNTEKRMNDFFSDADLVERYLDPSRKEFYNAVIAVAQKNNVDFKEKSIVDVGCGTGHLLSFLNEQFPESTYSGFDFSEAALLLAKRVLPKGAFRKNNIYEKPTEKFDIVICTEVLEHLTDPYTAYVNLLEGLKPSGSCVLSVPNGRKDNYDGHINFWSPESWKFFLERFSPPGCTVVTGEFENGTDLYAIIKI